tara:strand:- start:204 stop:389 length:186 start_codon:yes stop_codon:yes gene_type:complete
MFDVPPTCLRFIINYQETFFHAMQKMLRVNAAIPLNIRLQFSGFLMCQEKLFRNMRTKFEN